MTLLYDPVPFEDHAWLSGGKRAVIITTAPHAGKVICINITQKNADINGDGVPDQLNVKVLSSRVNLETGEPILIGDTPIGTNANVHSMSLDAITEGGVDVNNWIAGLIDESVQKCLRHEAALNAFSLIPISND